MKVLRFDEEHFFKRLQIMKPNYLFMNENTLTFLEKSWNGPYENVPYDFSFQGNLKGFQGNLRGIPVIIENHIPLGEIIFGVE